MEITFGRLSTFRKCISTGCPTGNILHFIGKGEEKGKSITAYQCAVCKRITTEEDPK